MTKSYLLDTHTLLWFLSGDDSLPNSLRSLIKNSESPCYLSIVSVWEIAIKVNLGKLNFAYSIEELEALLVKRTIEILPITLEHISALKNLEDIHRDPFDRMIISQAKTENLIVISKDEHFPNYSGVTVIWN